MTTINLPRLTARNHAEAVAQLRERRAILLQAAADLADRASLFVDVPEVADDLLAEARSLFEQAERCTPRRAS
ncbi:hypothetical protein I5G67_gp085 [Mycobacterium phage Aminay]|uniref:Uncharacterized protein n=1 Tax=Mycobacterium phage Aminay TaxID=2250291 RepID=A0A345KV69_9CAUD|nr:hypothetical protein I5G67_gp085 [Mycobacterium phage Aminay]AXH46921.1 hypothetical protein SEA_AMINAY_85 [Mycobacterium phage Aminay]